MKTLLGSASQVGANVLREDFCLPQRKLSSGGTELPRFRIGNRSTVTQGPYPWMTTQLERVLYHQRAPLVCFDWQQLQQRIRSRSRRPHKSLSTDFTVA